MPGKRCKTAKGRLRVTALTNALLIRELMNGPCTAPEPVQVTGLGARTVTTYMLALYRQRCVRIAAWERDSSGKQSIRCFAFGDAPDAKKVPTAREVGQVRAAARRKSFSILTHMRSLETRAQ